MHYLKQILHQAKQTLIREVIVDHHLVDNIYEICTQHGNDIFLVADENTVELLNKNVLNKISHLIVPSNTIRPLAKSYIISDASKILLSQCSDTGIQKKEVWIPVSSTGMTPGRETTPNSVASLETVNLVRNKAKDNDLIVAFGSGTVNDICKYASYLEKKDYISFPTAASMNGYTSANASVLVDGHKKSFAAHLPKAVYIDINIIANAPLCLTLSGFADFICRSTVEADWLLSHLLLGTEYNALPFALVRDLEKILLREHLALAKRSKKVVLLLMEALLISGLGMAISKGSHSASQGEHMIAHAMEMVTKDYSSLHGEKIAVTTLTMANLQEKILSIQNPTMKPINYSGVIPARDAGIQKIKYGSQCLGTGMTEDLAEYFGNTEFIKILKHKQILQQKIGGILHKEWNNISSLIKQNLLPAKRLQKIFEDLSIPHLPEHLSWNKEQYCKVVNLAFATRDRFTFLDLAHCIIEESEVL
ncbi:iron-containing alcohol dehydrogenase [Wolbachia endosymbiont of Ctenocephalides felis wCfeJ]|uniref:iron-containing alcohol dehydrogenase n=1 Tax=Wolbachia endosymbiont of Ctenocephalides felis wCfeJ TaxID=2732594 RepID=UPI00144560F2|nr:iron-containing alcohol dehydrogenase [Wolbachia endosymbiont of Ctenocephalides felis wCfeJ]WCR58445.1 MAG: Glycerol-1-phosphate dehydrogenase [NAD(P)+] [Wolbachia endosymbiont of Ctenocephalides felis wCfeJ]